MLLIKEILNKFTNVAFYGFFLLVFLYSGCNEFKQKKDSDLEKESKIFVQANILIENGDYDQAKRIYKKYIEKFPNHSLADDAAYRLAYLHVIPTANNSHFDYKKAEVLFQKFIETYENSRYINACKNWLNVLNLVNKSEENKTTSTEVKLDEIRRLQEKIAELEVENQKLKQTLEVLQRAIER